MVDGGYEIGVVECLSVMDILMNISTVEIFTTRSIYEGTRSTGSVLVHLNSTVLGKNLYPDSRL